MSPHMVQAFGKCLPPYLDPSIGSVRPQLVAWTGSAARGRMECEAPMEQSLIVSLGMRLEQGA
jgi:hypothetical protein